MNFNDDLPTRPIPNHGRRSSRIAQGKREETTLQENEHVKQLSAARSRLIADRRHAVQAIAEENRRGLNGDTCDALILIQTTIEAIDRALADETKLARERDALPIGQSNG